MGGVFICYPFEHVPIISDLFVLVLYQEIDVIQQLEREVAELKKATLYSQLYNERRRYRRRRRAQAAWHAVQSRSWPTHQRLAPRCRRRLKRTSKGQESRSVSGIT